MKLILASTSKIRLQLLINAGISVEAVSPGVDENRVRDENRGASPEALSILLADAKASAVSAERREALVIGADQILAFGLIRFDKPENMDAARRQLVQLRGNTHRLVSSATCWSNGRRLWTVTDSARLKMRNFTDQFLSDYVSLVGTDILSSVGGYKLEAQGVQLFETVEGDYFTILGLPILRLMKFLREKGVLSA